MKIEFQNVFLSFENARIDVLKNVNFHVNTGETLAILGYSGAGKSTILKMVASFMAPTSGHIYIDDNQIKKGNPHKKLGYLCQSSEKMLFPWMNVEQNVIYPLKLRGEAIPSNINYCNYLLKILNLSHRVKSYPGDLSGGEQKRLALAIVLSYKPDILLLDEPFAGLDLELSQQLWDIVYSEIEKRKPTVLLVTHSFDEAALLADRVIFISKSLTIKENENSAISFNIPRTLPRYEQLNHPSVVKYKQFLLNLFKSSLNE